MNGRVLMKFQLKNKLKTKVFLIITIVAIYFFIPSVNRTVNRVVFILSSVNVDMAKGYILSFGIWAPIVSFMLMIFQSIAAPLPAFVLTFANAGLFGWIKGAILSWSSALAGAVVCFYISRYFGREVVEKFTSSTALNSVDGFFEKYGKYTILITRLLPFVSFDLVSYAAGLTGMSFWSFFWATGIGQLPATIVYSYVGGMLVGGAKMMVFGLFILFALSILIFMAKKMMNEKSKRKEDAA
jgi:uncharacterized membrane protein YdjX (TVP38/TMEM64 family)